MVELSLLPGSLVVASLALPALLLLVHVVFAVATVTVGLQMLLVDTAGVTGGALGRLMLEMQGVFGVVVVIEGDRFPALLDVAGLAFLTELAFVALFVVVLLMAGVAGLRRVLVVLILVAGLALHVEVLAQQRVVGLAVIEAKFLPGPFDVTVGTLLAQPPLVDVVLAMTAIAGVRRIAVLGTRFVAILAFYYAFENR